MWARDEYKSILTLQTNLVLEQNQHTLTYRAQTDTIFIFSSTLLPQENFCRAQQGCIKSKKLLFLLLQNTCIIEQLLPIRSVFQTKIYQLVLCSLQIFRCFLQHYNCWYCLAFQINIRHKCCTITKTVYLKISKSVLYHLVISSKQNQNFRRIITYKNFSLKKSL